MCGQAGWKNNFKFHRALAALLLCAGFALHAADAVLEVSDATGVKVQPFTLNENDSRRATLLIFTTIDCPVANSYAPELERIQKEFTPKGVKLFLIYVDPSVTAVAVQKHSQEYAFTIPVLLDPKHELAKFAEATVTPEAALFDRAGLLLYRGRIDNRYFDYGKSRPEATVHDLRDALTASIQNKPIPTPRTKAVGCLIGDLKAAAPKTDGELGKEKKP